MAQLPSGLLLAVRSGMQRRIPRRDAITMVGAAGAVLALGCGDQTPTSPSSTSGGAAGGACAVTPPETAGPFPSLADFIRSDIREGRPGTPLALTISVVNANSACSPMAGVNVEVWQCDAVGDYSQYGSQQSQTFLRGIQTTNVNGEVTFATIYPGWYQGRATHIHVEVLRDGSSLAVTQIAFPETTNAAVYRTGVYAPRGTNPTSNARDGVFADSLNSQLATVSGDASTALTASFRIALSA